MNNPASSQTPRPIGEIVEELRAHPDHLVTVVFCTADLNGDTRSIDEIDFAKMEDRMTEFGHDFLM
ncbi:MAG: hypothetical protein JHD02_00330 [Thermoleophilaceae bacterium]|nr:hypothetical protein [Thermoleophilaceae bacterium]